MTPVRLLAAWIALAAALAAPADDRLAALESAVARGDHEAVVREAERLLAALPAADRLVAWELDYRGQTVQGACLGHRYVYLFSRVSRYWKSDPASLELTPTPSHICPDARQYDAVLAVTCVDGLSGRRLWTRHEYPNERYAVDPRDDALWLWGETHGTRQAQRVDPVSGDTTLSREMPLTDYKYNWVRGLRMGGVPIWSGRSPNDPRDQSAVEFDLDASEYREHAPHPATVSFNRLRVLRGEGAYPNGPFEGKPLWRFPVAPAEYSFPEWLGADVLLVAGGRSGPSIVYRLAGANGQVRWATRLSDSPYMVNLVQLRNGSYAAGGWLAANRSDDFILVLSRAGTIHFLCAEDGHRVAEFDTRDAFLAMPVVIDNRLIVAGCQRLSAYPLSRLAEPLNNEQWRILSPKAKALLALGQNTNALEAARLALTLYPKKTEAWKLWRDVCAQAASSDQALAAEIRYVRESGQPTSAWLREKYGILWCPPTDPVSEPLVQAGGLILCATKSGSLLTMDPVGRAMLDREELDGEPIGLYVRGDTLFVRNMSRALRTFGGMPPTLFDPDPLTPMDEPPGLPPPFYTRSGYDREPVRIGARWFRPLNQGRVRATDGVKVEEFRPRVEGMGTWRILPTEAGPLGYGAGGVYVLDENGSPARRLLKDQTGADAKLGEVSAIAVAGDCLGVLIGGYKQDARLQLWRRDGSALVREEVLTGSAGGLWLWGDGLFVSGQELAWMPFDPARPIWRFRLPADPVLGERAGWSSFGAPRFFPDRLAAASSAGGVLVFALDALAKD